MENARMYANTKGGIICQSTKLNKRDSNMRTLLVVLFYFLILSHWDVALAQHTGSQDIFWENLSNYCGKAFEGEVLEAPPNDNFRNMKLIMHVRSCSEKEIRIPFFVGEDKSRTWVFSKLENGLLLKHDHRHEDGTDEEITMYGGKTSNNGMPTVQFFPADEETRQLIEYAAGNIWWITLADDKFGYQLRRIGTDRHFSIVFDLSRPVDVPEAPWGWED
jgi:hypothetical protein